MKNSLNIVICGHGPGAIALAALIIRYAEDLRKVNILTLSQSKLTSDIIVRWPDGINTSIKKCIVSSHPENIISIADIILICHLTHLYSEVLNKIAPYISSKTKLLCAMPGVSGFDWAVRRSNFTNNADFFIGGTESLPFIAKYDEKNKNHVDVLAFKKKLYFATDDISNTSIRLIEEILNYKFKKCKNFLFLTFLNPGAKVHPILLKEAFKNKKKKYFYSLSQSSENLLLKIEDEIKFLYKTIGKETSIPINTMPSFSEWLLDCYAPLIKNTSSVNKCLSTHKIYKNLSFSENDYDKSNLRLRYLDEDVFSLLVIRDLGKIFNFNMVSTESIINFYREFLKQNKISSWIVGVIDTPNILSSYFGIDTISKLVRIYLPHSKKYKVEKNEFDKNGIVFFGKLISKNFLQKIDEEVSKKLSQNRDPEKTLNLHLTNDFFAKICSIPIFVKTACQLLNENEVRIFSSIIVLKEPHGKMLIPWHQDGAFDWPLEPIDCASLWLALDNAHVENAAFRSAVGAHKCGKFSMIETNLLKQGEFLFSTQLKRSISDELLLNYKKIYSDMQRGECSFHHNMLPHESGINTTNFRRVAFVIRYCKKNAVLNLYKGMPREDFFKKFVLFNPHLYENTEEINV